MIGAKVGLFGVKPYKSRLSDVDWFRITQNNKVISGLLELSTYLNNEKGQRYKQAAVKMLKSLSSSTYQSRDKNPAFLLHSTGHYPKGSQIDAS